MAGILVHGDIQLARVEEYLSSLVEKHIPKEDHFGFVFMLPIYGVEQGISKTEVCGL